jgi:radical SAM superfamily enzyme YgiQ (UPF0313 family)
VSNIRNIKMHGQAFMPRPALKGATPTSGPVRVGLVQINNSFSGHNYLPYSVGLLQAYVERHSSAPDRYEFLVPLYTRIPVADAVARMREADVVAFSVYVWNFRISLEIARRIKREKPETLIIFGGPHVPDRAQGFLQQYPFIDVACHGEGEAVFLALLERFPDRDWREIPSLSWLDADRFVTTPRAERLRDLSAVPSPYLAGVFDRLMAENPEEKWLVLWETNRGCPFQCTFCDWGSAIAAKVSQFEMERLRSEVDWFAAHEVEFVFCCDANFAMLPRDYDLAGYVAQKKRETGYPRALSVQNTKNATERAYKVQKLLSDAGLNKGVAISLQSVDMGTLEAIKRQNISTASYQELQRRFTRDRVETYSDLILGLPGESYDSFTRGVSTVIENGQHNRIQFNNLSVLPNAEMGDPEYQRRYGMELVESKIINIHGSVAEADAEIVETQQLVVATASMPRNDWVRARAFSWMAGLLHFDKVLQIPLIVAHEVTGIAYRDLFEAFLSVSPARHPVLSEIRDFFFDKARDIQRGGVEYCQSKQWLNIFWPADEYILIKLCMEDKLSAFYAEAANRLAEVCAGHSSGLRPALLGDAMALNQALLKRPFQQRDLVLETRYNVWQFYRSVLVGEQVPLVERPCANRIDRTSQTYDSWDVWLREVIWYGNKKGAYLYGNNLTDQELAGHY